MSKANHITANEPALPWMLGDLSDARETIIKLMAQVNQAYETGELDKAEALDGELDGLQEYVESAISDLEADGMKLIGNNSMEILQSCAEYSRPGDQVDAESGLTETLAAIYEDYTEEQLNPNFGPDYETTIGSIRDSVEEFHGTHAHLSDMDMMLAAKDAFDNTGRMRATQRPSKNPAFAPNLQKIENLLNGQPERVQDNAPDDDLDSLPSITH